MTDPTTDPQTDDAVLAGELALRVLEPLDEARARARAEADAVFAAEVEAWNDRLAAFVQEIQPVEPSADVWPRISDRLYLLDEGGEAVVPGLDLWRATSSIPSFPASCWPQVPCKRRSPRPIGSRALAPTPRPRASTTVISSCSDRDRT